MLEHVVVRFESLCCMQGVSVCLHGFVHWAGVLLSIMMRCCSLSVSCNISAADVYLGVVEFKLVNRSLSWQNCSNSAAKGQ